METATAQLDLLEQLVIGANVERVWALAMTGTGVLAMLVALALWLVWHQPLTRRVAAPLAILGAIFALGGGIDFVRATRDRQRLPDELREAPHLLAARLERERDARLTHQVLEGFDVALVVLGLGLAIRPARWRGAGLAVVLMGALGLVFDAAAVARHDAQVALLERAGG
ncbi:MAG: hypothetical protein JNJ54_20095 [Myxococcaceae bacterium]|nr:hypothetical protein [Myxococcaceae bacterium]